MCFFLHLLPQTMYAVKIRRLFTFVESRTVSLGILHFTRQRRPGSSTSSDSSDEGAFLLPRHWQGQETEAVSGDKQEWKHNGVCSLRKLWSRSSPAMCKGHEPCQGLGSHLPHVLNGTGACPGGLRLSSQELLTRSPSCSHTLGVRKMCVP